MIPMTFALVALMLISVSLAACNATPVRQSNPPCECADGS